MAATLCSHDVKLKSVKNKWFILHNKCYYVNVVMTKLLRRGQGED